MDVHRNTRERVFSILNDNDCPSFVIRQKHTPPPTTRLPSISSLPGFSPRLERPNLFRHPHFERNPSISSTGSPPLLRYDSTSSASSKSSSSMDSTPSPITPAYNLHDATLVPYDSLLRQDMNAPFLASPTSITPFIEQGMMIGPVPTGQDNSYSKSVSSIAPAVFPGLAGTNDMVQLPTPTLSANASVSSASSAPHPSKSLSSTNANNSNNNVKKNKYPCPYAQSHNCSATFTTSGHAARHGKKHTGEKGVHCPICDKAFTRKDNMKQHERTHKNHSMNGNADEKKSKAQQTRDAQKVKSNKKEDTEKSQNAPPLPAHIRKSSSGISDPSDITLAPNPVDTPVDISPTFFPDPNPQIVLPVDSNLLTDPSIPSMYPPLIDEGLVASGLLPQPTDKLDIPIHQPPTLVRGFSDLDTLAQAAAYDPYYQQGQF